MEQADFKAKALKILNGPPSEISKIWDLLEGSDSDNVQIKLFREDGDKRPFRAIIFVDGEEAVREVLAFVDKREKAKKN